MTVSGKAAFKPMWTSAPGGTIADILKRRGMTVHAFAERMGHPVGVIEDLLNGKVQITNEIARRLEGAVGGSSAFWQVRERQFREDTERLSLKERDESHKAWLKELPLNDMLKFGWVASLSAPLARAEHQPFPLRHLWWG